MSLTVLHAVDYTDKASSGDYYTVSRENTWLTKRISKTGDKAPASFPKMFRLGDYYNPKSLEELLPILESLAIDPKALAIRHKYVRANIGDTVLRRADSVRTVAGNIIAIDVDDLELPQHLSSTDIKGQGEYVCNILHRCNPEIFPDDMGFIAQGSSSAGLTKSIKLHLWLCNYDKIDQAQLRNLFYHTNSTYKAKFEVTNNLVDPALYHDVQPHYTAAPVFECPNNDPLPENRTVYVYGNNSYVPETYSAYVKPVETTDEEREEFYRCISGGIHFTETLEKKLNRVLSWLPTESGLRNEVVSLYHTAVQDQFCLITLENIITPVVEALRPGMTKEYIRQGKVSAVNNIKACSIRELPRESKGLKLTSIGGGEQEKYLAIASKLPENGVTFLKATLGTGKTHTIATMLKKGTITGKFLALTDTSALVESNAIRFEAGDFRSSKARLDFATGRIDRLSGTLHSLLKIKELATSFDFLFIDEADSLLNNLLFASIINEEKKAQIVEVLADLLKHTDRVVISDGDISEETVACYIDLMQGSRDLYRINHIRQNLKNVVATRHWTEGSLWGAVQGCLSLGEKCLVVSDSSPNSLNEYLTAFERIFPNKNIQVAHADAKMDEEMVDIVNNTTHALHRREIDALLCSPSITNGVDFNYFDTVFVITKTENHTPNMRFQAMMREREPSSIHYFFSNLKSYATGYSGLSLDKGFTAQARQSLALRREREYKTYVATFNYYLMRSGAIIDAEDDPYENPLETVDKENQEIERITAILNSSEGNFPKRHNDAFEVKKLIKYYYDLEELAWDDVAKFLKDKPHDRAEYLYKIFKDFWPTLSLCDPQVLANDLKERGNKFYLATGESFAGGIRKARQILGSCGIKKDTDNAIAWLKKYCDLTPGAELPEILKDDVEDAVDL